ncbi:MAG: hypothetical protein HPY89_00465 [Pelotomaculum sp.]|nr:hypothetical protein [Pelotomaculum sp.]
MRAERWDKGARVEVEVVYNQDADRLAVENAYSLLVKYLLENERGSAGESGKSEASGA